MSARFTSLALVSFWVATFIHADPSAEEKAFIATPGAQRLSIECRTVKAADLPHGLLEEIRRYDAFSDHGNEASEFLIFPFDLNQDGKNEYFVCGRQGGGSGGPYYQVFAEIDSHWQSIAVLGGIVFVWPAHRGEWPKLASVTRGGGGIWAKTHHEFKKHQYEDVLLEHYDQGTITKETLPRK
jgi:hypothetical protein